MRKINTRSFVRATRSTTRDINRQIVLNLVREHQPISRADLARQMRVGGGMVTSLVDELLADGSIYEGATVDAPCGRKPMMLYVRTHDRLAIAVDVRFSRTFLMLSDFSGTPIATESFDTIVDPALVTALGGRITGCSRRTARRGQVQRHWTRGAGQVDHQTGRVLNARSLAGATSTCAMRWRSARGSTCTSRTR